MWVAGGPSRIVREIAAPLARTAVAQAFSGPDAQTFRWQGEDLRYLAWWSAVFCRASATPTGLRLANVLSKLNSERAIEIPIAKSFARRMAGARVLEVGNVMGHYARLPSGWDVIDRYEVMAGVRNEDIAAVTPTPVYDAVISLSTLEHVGWDEPNPDPSRFRRALGNCCGFLRAGGEALLTVPLRYNPGVDAWLREGAAKGFEFQFFARSGHPGCWSLVDSVRAWSTPGGIAVVSYRAW
jgi:hypothetical protein